MSTLKAMKASELKAALPFEVTSDGVVIAVAQAEYKATGKGKTQCPNCKLVYDYAEPDGKPYFFTMKHPKGSK